MLTKENLKNAFAGESQANRKYLAFAKKAEKEGSKEVSKLFKAAANAETIHALNHLKVMGEVKSTKENLKSAINAENYEHTDMYPKFIKEAKNDGNKDAKQSFEWANKVEKIHESLYKKALKKLENDDETDERIFVCQNCGNTVEDEAPETCPICGFPKTMFKEIE